MSVLCVSERISSFEKSEREFYLLWYRICGIAENMLSKI
jgi:hypothetical protein